MQNESVVAKEMPSDLLLWNETEGFIRIGEGTGDNLLKEDIADGYVDYINLDFLKYHEGELKEQDGGMVMLKELYQEKFATTYDLINYLIVEEEIPDCHYMILTAE